MTSVTENGLIHDEVVHTTIVDAAPLEVYALVADVRRWPYSFAPTVHVEVLGAHDHAERIQLWATANGKVRTWTSQRVLDPASLRVIFRQEIPAAPVVAMEGEWELLPTAGGGTEVRLHHRYSVADQDGYDQVTRAVDTNSVAELAGLKKLVEEGSGAHSELVFSFEDSIFVEGEAEDAYDFLYRADRWATELSHVAAITVDEEDLVQTMRMDTVALDGSTHTTESVRVCFPNHSIVYKQTKTPPVMAAHTGRWTVEPIDAGVRVRSEHTVVVRPEMVTELLGPSATLTQAKTMIRNSLGANSRKTLASTKKAVEARFRALAA
ncbi:MAG TPA: aromatase/cyclase [Propionibacteriaceae bacterium]